MKFFLMKGGDQLHAYKINSKSHFHSSIPIAFCNRLSSTPSLGFACYLKVCMDEESGGKIRATWAPELTYGI